MLGVDIAKNLVEAGNRRAKEQGLTNIARYADATEARVAAAVSDGRLIVTVSDNGRGGADPVAGSGLRGLADRLAAIGGELHVASTSGTGTTLTATLPTIP